MFIFVRFIFDEKRKWYNKDSIKQKNEKDTDKGHEIFQDLFAIGRIQIEITVMFFSFFSNLLLCYRQSDCINKIGESQQLDIFSTRMIIKTQPSNKHLFILINFVFRIISINCYHAQSNTTSANIDAPSHGGL